MAEALTRSPYDGPERSGRHYYRRIALLSVLLCALILCATALAARRTPAPRRDLPPTSAAALAPRCDDEGQSDTVALVAQTPNGPNVPRDSPITATFSCPVDHRAVELAFVLYPPAEGNFTWDGDILIFSSTEPLQPHTAYRVTFFGGLRDARGFVDGRKVSWPFITRADP